MEGINGKNKGKIILSDEKQVLFFEDWSSRPQEVLFVETYLFSNLEIDCQCILRIQSSFCPILENFSEENLKRNQILTRQNFKKKQESKKQRGS